MNRLQVAWHVGSRNDRGLEISIIEISIIDIMFVKAEESVPRSDAGAFMLP